MSSCFREWATVIALLGRVAFPAILAVEALTAETGTLRIQVEARRVAPVAGEAEGLHWVIVGDPVIDSFPNVRAAEKMRGRIERIKVDAACVAKVAVPPHRCYALAGLEGEGDDFTDSIVRTPTELSSPPTGPAAARDFSFTVEYTERPESVIESLKVEVETEFSRERPGARVDPVDIPYAEAARRVSAPEIPELKTVTVRLQYTSLDLSRGRRKPVFSAMQAENALLRVVLLVLDEVRQKQVMPGRPTPPAETQNAFRDLLAPKLLIDARNWPNPVVNVTQSEDGKVITVRVENLRIVGFARIEVRRGQIENNKGELVNFRGADRQSEKELREEVEATEQSFNREYRQQLEALEGTVPDPEAVKRLSDALRGRKELRGALEVEGFGDNLVFASAKSWVIGKLDAKVSVNAALTPEDIFTGEGTVSGERLLINLLRRDVGETYAFTLRGGPQVQTAEFVFGIPRSRGQTWVANYGGDLTATYSRDADQKIGALTVGEEGRRITEREKGLLPRVYGQVRRSAENSRWTYLVRGEALLDWRHLLLSPSWMPVKFTDGQMAAPTLRLRHALKYELGGDGRGIGSMAVDLKAEGRRGLTAIGGDFDFCQYLVSGSVESFFGIANRRDFRVRYRHGFGAASSGTPVYQLFRLGGPNSLYGIEEGEFVGLGIGFGQAEGGVSARFLWSLVRRKPAQASSGDAGAPKPPIRLDQIYATVLYGRATVLAEPRLGELLAPTGPAWGRGIAVELRGLSNRANLSIGYAKSPQSRIHRKGLMIIGVDFDF